MSSTLIPDVKGKGEALWAAVVLPGPSTPPSPLQHLVCLGCQVVLVPLVKSFWSGNRVCHRVASFSPQAGGEATLSRKRALVERQSREVVRWTYLAHRNAR
jgi:hypothetical protein